VLALIGRSCLKRASPADQARRALVADQSRWRMPRSGLDRIRQCTRANSQDVHHAV